MEAKDLLPPTLVEQEVDPQFEAAATLETLARHLDLEDWILNRLRHCERETLLNLPILRHDGTAVSFTAYRVQHLSWRGPTIGGVVLAPTLHLASVRADAMEATWQAALLDLPFGGAAGAIVCNSEELSERELRFLAKDYVYGLRGLIGCHSDVLTPGAGCNEQTMAWMLDSFGRTQHATDLGAITGKPANMWGLPGSADLTARGVIANLHALGTTDLHHQRISVQGFGALGASIAEELCRHGARIVSVADISGGLYRPSGIDIPALRHHANSRGMIFGFPDAEQVCNADVLEADCDILITAAAEHQIGAHNAEKIKARTVVEAGRWAVTRSAQELLANKGVTVVPEILAAAGGAIGAFLEWSQCVRLSAVSPQEIERELITRIASAWRSVKEAADRHHAAAPPMAHLVALTRIAEELRLRN